MTKSRIVYGYDLDHATNCHSVHHIKICGLDYKNSHGFYLMVCDLKAANVTPLILRANLKNKNRSIKKTPGEEQINLSVINDHDIDMTHCIITYHFKRDEFDIHKYHMDVELCNHDGIRVGSRYGEIELRSKIDELNLIPIGGFISRCNYRLYNISGKRLFDNNNEGIEA